MDKRLKGKGKKLIRSSEILFLDGKKRVYTGVCYTLSLTDQSSAYFLHIYISGWVNLRKMMEKGLVIRTMWNKMRTIDFSMDERDVRVYVYVCACVPLFMFDAVDGQQHVFNVWLVNTNQSHCKILRKPEVTWIQYPSEDEKTHAQTHTPVHKRENGGTE